MQVETIWGGKNPQIIIKKIQVTHNFTAQRQVLDVFASLFLCEVILNTFYILHILLNSML